MMFFRRWVKARVVAGGFAMALTGAPVHAVEVIGEGMASVAKSGGTESSAARDSALRSAKAEAVRQALADAASRSGVEVRSTQVMSLGQMVSDLTQVRAKAKVKTFRVIEEREEGDYYLVKVLADVVDSTPVTGFNPLGWTIKEYPISEGRLRILLTKPLVRYLTQGGDGEYLEVVRSYVRVLQDEMGYAKYSIDKYTESLRSGLLIQERVVEVEVSFQR